MTSNEIRAKYLKFFEKRGHTIVPSASLIPANYPIPDKGSLFTTAGMQPLIPYLLGEKHPAGTKIVDVQKCVRTGDIDDVGDNRHLTFFEMLGNWSLGDPASTLGGYFKKDSIAWSLEFLTSREEGLGLDPRRLYVTVFKGEPNEGIPKDEESMALWQENFAKIGIKAEVAGEDEIIGEIPGLPPTPSQGRGERPGYFTANYNNWKLLQEKALEMRKNPTEAEEKLWQLLRKNNQYNFRRQHVVDNFIADFICLPKNLIIEVDGDIHDLQKERDQERTDILENIGYKIIRFKNEEILADVDIVLNKITKTLDGISEVLPLGEDLGEAFKEDLAYPQPLPKEGEIRIIPLGKDDNFWIAGATGPCGGDTEIFYDVIGEEKGGKLEGKFADLVKAGRIIEVWNNVFMEFNKTVDGKYEKLAKPNVDTGMGLERTTVVMQGKQNVFETDLFEQILAIINSKKTKENIQAERVVADHIRSAVFMITDGVIPANTEAGYVLRRVLRRAIRFADNLGIENTAGLFEELAVVIVKQYKDAYPELVMHQAGVVEELLKEEKRFKQTLQTGLKEFDKIKGQDISGIDAFKLFTTFGFPFELTLELAKENNIKVDIDGFNIEMQKHQELSKVGAEQKFKGGLAGTGEMETKYHTATHLLNAALRQVLGSHVSQKGSNITAERLRFDFVHGEKMTDEQKKKVEDYVNGVIALKLSVSCKEMSVSEAKTAGALGVFDDKYAELVKVYTVGGEADFFSKEICGGPHVENTSALASVRDPEGNPKGGFKILKEESVSAGVRRIKAILE